MKDIFRLNSLNKKIIVYIIIIITLCLVVSAVIISLVVEYQMIRKYQVEKEAVIESLSYSLAPMLDFYDYKQIELTITSLLVYENISYIAIFDGSGNQVRAVIEQNVSIEDLDTEKHDIAVDGAKIGSFEIGFSKEYIDNQIRTTTLALILGLTGFLIFAGIVLYHFLGHSVIKPIQLFTKTVEKLNPENLSERTQVSTDDEIGTLATSFNRMAEDLEKSHIALIKARNELEQRVQERTRGERRRSEQLRQINEVSRRISSILSLDRLIPYVVDSLQETFNYYNVNIFLKDTDSEDLELKAGAGGFKEKVPIGFLIRENRGIIGSVAQNGEPLVVNDVSEEPKYIYVEQLPDTKSELAVPIKIGEEILGVLDIESTELNAFDEIDLFTAQTLGDQVAIAIENARLYQETREVAVLDERNRMAREIHDTLAQGFTGIVLQLEAAEQALSENTEEVLKHLGRAKELARDSLKEARRSVWALRPETLEESSLIDTIRQQIAKFTQDSGVPVQFNTDVKKHTLPIDIESALLRICQESLTNVQKHAKASQVELTLVFEENAVRMTIHDNGVGFNPESPRKDQFGLIDIHERVHLLNGTIDVRSEKQKGTCLEVRIPLIGG